MDRKMVNFIKEQYPPGTRIRLNSMEDPYHPILPGTEGEVDFVDDEGQIFMKWNNGRTLPLAPGKDSFTVLPPKLTTLKLYMPLTADLYERNEYGEFDDSSTLLEGSELRGYQDQITAALVKNRMPEESERGLMHWYDEADSVNRKVHSAVFAAEERDRQLWGVAECRVAGELSDTEMDTLKEFITGQASDGWGEGFEQREISVDDGGELYVHLWNSDQWSIQTEQELFSPKLAEGLPELCFSTLPGTGELICIKRGESGYYRRTQEQPSSSSDEVMQAEREFFPLSIGYRGDMAFQNAEVIDVPKFLAGEIVSHKELTSSELWGLLFERTEVEMAAYMRGLDHLERDELIQSAEEISAMQVCRRGLMAKRKKLTRRNVLFLLQVEKPLGMISEVWMEQQNAEEGNAFSRLLAELYKQKGNGYLIDDEQPETVKQMLESCPNNCFMLLMPQGILKLASDEAEKALRGEEYTVLLDYSGDSEPIKTADLLEMVVIDMRKDEQGCWYVLVVHPKLLEALRREKKMT